MAYDALLHGANAVLYWGTAYMKPSGSETSHGPGRPQLWHDLLRLARELRALEPALVGEPGPSLVVHEAASYGSREHPGVIATLHHTGVDDVLIVADPYDTSDHLQDGYGIVQADRFQYMWFDHNLLPENQRERQWITFDR